VIRTLFACLLSSSLLFAEEEPPAAVKPAIKQINDHQLQIGKIKLDQKTKEISFEAGLNMNEGLLEYALVLTKGKVHESLFLTDISPINLNIAIKLLGIQESPELFEIMDENYNLTGKYPKIPDTQRKASLVDIVVRWKDGETVKTEALNNLILNSVTEQPMLAGSWLNTGSYMHDGKYKADVAGDLIAIFTAQPAMINYPGKDRDNDDIWVPNKKRLPELNAVVTVILKPHKN